MAIPARRCVFYFQFHFTALHTIFRWNFLISLERHCCTAGAGLGCVTCIKWLSFSVLWGYRRAFLLPSFMVSVKPILRLPCRGNYSLENFPAIWQVFQEMDSRVERFHPNDCLCRGHTQLGLTFTARQANKISLWLSLRCYVLIFPF
jgi:hypothetical protein